MNSKKTGQKLYLKAKKIIPGGNMFLSKRPEMHLPDNWPSYFSKAKGCNVWDLDNIKYTDTSIMGIGTNTLGYGHKEIDDFVIKKIKLGNLSTLNCPEEVALAEKLIEINPWADMVRFARSGGEANAIAIRIARAASGKDNVAICGYHGWHDWYLSVNHNIKGDDLTSHLLPGLKPSGVPKNLKDTVFPFSYNDFNELEKLVKNKNIGVIKMEVERNFKPKDDFLKKVRNLATKNNIVLIFDECTSGFRETFGGIFKKYNVEPDMAMFGKTLGNGFAITAVVGRKNIMEAAQNTFISSTFWSERSGPSAALKTLEIMEREKSWLIITELGNKMRHGWKQIAEKHNVEIELFGIPALSSFMFAHSDKLKYKTFLTQEFLKHGFLASTNFYPSTAHSEKIIDEYLYIFEKTLFTISRSMKNNTPIDSMLDGPIVHGGFKRLN